MRKRLLVVFILAAMLCLGSSLAVYAEGPNNGEAPITIQAEGDKYKFTDNNGFFFKLREGKHGDLKGRMIDDACSDKQKVRGKIIDNTTWYLIVAATKEGDCWGGRHCCYSDR